MRSALQKASAFFKIALYKPEIIRYNRGAFSHRGIAQLVEQRSPKPRAEGSSPSAPAKKTPDFARNQAFFILFGELTWTAVSVIPPRGASNRPMRVLRFGCFRLVQHQKSIRGATRQTGTGIYYNPLE